MSAALQDLLLLCLLLASCTWHGDCINVPVHFQNVGQEEVSVIWSGKDANGTDQQKTVAKLKPEDGHRERTFIGMVFILRSGKKEQRLEIQSGGTVTINFPEISTKWDPAVSLEAQEKEIAHCLKILEAAALIGDDEKAPEEDADNFCRRFPARRHVFDKSSVEVWPDAEILEQWRRRERLNEIQPSYFRNFTKVGFKLLRRDKNYGKMLPEGFSKVMDKWQAWYEEFRRTANPEEAGRYEGVISNYENDNFVISPPQHLVDETAASIAMSLEDWGKIERGSLELTAYYGLRLYRRNAMLRSHVDMWETHVLSAIVKVGDRGLQKQWPLEILDHNGTKHQVFDQPGDVILYESATCEHGRSGPLKGREVANIFFHFRPKTGWGPEDPYSLIVENRPGSLAKAIAELEKRDPKGAAALKKKAEKAKDDAKKHEKPEL